MRIIQLYTNDGRRIASLDTDNSTVYKQVKGGTHMLRKPPAWTYDESLITEVEKWVKENPIPELQFVINTTDWKSTYRINWSDFKKFAYSRQLEQDHTQKQWVVPLKHWTIDDIEPKEKRPVQNSLF